MPIFFTSRPPIKLPTGKETAEILVMIVVNLTSISAVSLPVGSFIGGLLVKNIGIDFTLVIGGGSYIFYK
jgi:hypothetical protein